MSIRETRVRARLSVDGNAHARALTAMGRVRTAPIGWIRAALIGT